MVACAPDNVEKKCYYYHNLFLYKKKGVDASDMQNPILQYKILNKDICKMTVFLIHRDSLHLKIIVNDADLSLPGIE